MKNKKGLIGTIILIVVLLFAIAGFITYNQIKKNGVQLSSGELSIDIQFNQSKDSEPQIDLSPNMSENNETNKTNSTEKEIVLTSQDEN